MPNPRNYMDKNDVYVRGYVRHKHRKRGNNDIWLFLFLVMMVVILYYTCRDAFVPIVILCVVGYTGIWLLIKYIQWRIWRIDDNSKRKFWVYVIKGKING
jgi:hypothetical protein